MIGLVIKRVRKEQGLTQKELAERAELNRTTINKIERLQRCPTVDTLIGIGRGLGVPASELLRQIEGE